MVIARRGLRVFVGILALGTGFPLATPPFMGAR